MNKTLSLAGAVIGALGIACLLGLPIRAQEQAAADCAFYLKNTFLTDQAEMPVGAEEVQIVPGMLPPCAPAVSDKGKFADIVDNLQHDFDVYSWLTFIALNSPVDGTTAIGKGPGPGGDAPTVWESYRQLPDVMLERGETPPAWGEPIAIPEACGVGTVKPGTMVIHMEEETFNQPFKSGPLIDQNGNYALFVILMNRQMFNYIYDNQLYSREAQADFVMPVNFPVGFNKRNSDPANRELGSVMVKTSWKVLGGDDVAEKFHTIEGLVYTPANKISKTAATCVSKRLGMIGFHVGHKTDFNPQWVWTTFEHVDNVPDHADAVAGDNLRRRYNFYDRNCTSCPVNRPPDRPWDPAVQPFPNGFKSQITRVIPLTEDATKLNEAAHLLGGINGTVWENYMLVSTQWPTAFDNPIDKSGVPAPPFLANTTLETYSQGKVPLASSSCIACHLNATTRPPRGSKRSAVSSDFTFILEKAKSIHEGE